jgi:hypothetical protein
MRLQVAGWLFIAVPTLVSAQMVAKKPSFMPAGIIEHHGTLGTLSANDPRPLFQAVEAIGQEYGWVIDFEDPPYRSHFDLADSTDPDWRASHPNDKGVTRIAGGEFQSQFAEPLKMGDWKSQWNLRPIQSPSKQGRFVYRECFEKNSQITSLASIFFEVFPIQCSPRYCTPPGQACPPLLMT